MIQFYFLSILLNLMTGSILLYSSANLDGDSDLESEKKSSFIKSLFEKIFGSSGILEDSLFILVVAFLSFFTGIIKLFFPVNKIIIFGDLLPSLTGILGGLSLLFSYYSEKSDVAFQLPSFLEKIFVSEKNIFGILSIIIAILHFILPGVLFL